MNATAARGHEERPTSREDHVSVEGVTRRIRAPRGPIYRALLDPRAIEVWRVPDGMCCVVHEFAPHEGGCFRVSLSYDDAAIEGKSGGHTDTYHGRFARLIPDEQIVECLEFDAEDPRLQGEMTVTTTLTEADGATDVTIAYENLPAGVSEADNQLGTEMALGKLAALVESGDTVDSRTSSHNREG
jgi:uncharacterized protein YndB with AHSA1/START domain